MLLPGRKTPGKSILLGSRTPGRSILPGVGLQGRAYSCGIASNLKMFESLKVNWINIGYELGAWMVKIRQKR